MSVYLDASVLVALFTHDAMSAQADAFLRSRAEVVIVSDFAAAELASAIARKVRMGNLSVEQAQAAFSDFDAWMVRSVECSRLLPADIAVAATFLRRLNLSLRAPDAMNIAIAQRVGATLATLDQRMALDAATLGVLAPPL